MRLTRDLLDVVVLGSKPIDECVTVAVGLDGDFDADKRTQEWGVLRLMIRWNEARGGS